jgi:gamma-glutamylcyclotransferase (GGCT)/AIG2-like uncharacterized protein YtfP
MNLFVYGTLMEPAVMRAVTGREFPSASAEVEGYARYQVIGEVYPALVPRAGARTRGLLYQGVDEETLARLDAYEGGWYRRESVCVRSGDGPPVEADAYVFQEAQAHRLSPLPWDAEAFRRHALDEFGVR